MLPGSARDYSRQELARDLYLLDQSGVTTTKDGRVLRLPASALTRGSGVLRTVTRTNGAVRENPEAAASVLRFWLSQDAAETLGGQARS